MRTRKITCSMCGISGDELDKIGFTYYNGDIVCLKCYRKVVGTVSTGKGYYVVEEEEEEESRTLLESEE